MAAHLTRSNCKGVLRSAVMSNAMDKTDNVLWNGSEGDGNVRSEKEIKVLTVKMETVALFGKGR
jgi:hypothetical protein